MGVRRVDCLDDAHTNDPDFRIMLAKIEQADRLRQVLRQIPIRQGEEGWNCVLWVKDALDNLT